MRVVVAPDGFTGTLSAVEAAGAIAAGWAAAAPHDEVIEVPLSDGGPGFVDVLAATMGGQLHAVTVRGPLGGSVPGAVLITADATAYVESAQACGLALVPPDERDVWHASSYGVGELVLAAVDAGATTVVVGLGGSGTNDGGAGFLAALGAEPREHLLNGAAGLAALAGGALDLARVRDRLGGVRLVAASDVDNPLLGLRGASNVYAPQKGALPSDLPALDGSLATFAEAADRALADAPGAGAAGGLGYGLLLADAERVPGIATVIERVGFADAVRGAGLVVTGEGSFDWQSLRGKVVHGVAAACEPYGVPCVVLAGRVDVGRREMNANGIESAYAMADLPGGLADALARPEETLATLAARVARSWSPQR